MLNIKRRFAIYHAKNPHVYTLFKKFAFAAAAEKRQYSADAVLHRMRWFTDIETTGDPFKINNNYAAYYARLFMSDFPQHEGFFRTRRSEGQRQIDMFEERRENPFWPKTGGMAPPLEGVKTAT